MARLAVLSAKSELSRTYRHVAIDILFIYSRAAS